MESSPLIKCVQNTGVLFYFNNAIGKPCKKEVTQKIGVDDFWGGL
jgi:hypothetical protein